MKMFCCSTCGQIVFFENVRCTRCGSTLAYLPDHAIDVVVDRRDGVLVASAAEREGRSYRLCQNSIDHGVCNWAVPANDDNPYCRGCRLNDIIPDLSHPGALIAWGRIEHAKKRLLNTLFELRLPVEGHLEKEGWPCLFVQGKGGQSRAPDLTGHDDGRITLNIAEADNPGREKLREQLGETYRTLLGHFRHEIGHYYWDVWSGTRRAGPVPRPLRRSRQDYGAGSSATTRGRPAGLADSFVSAYATMHPWEDWAETWAHYLHIVDTLGTARSYGMR